MTNRPPDKSNIIKGEKIVKKLLSVILCVILMLGMLSVSAADASYRDTNGHWAKECISEWSGLGILTGFDGSFMPDNPITRGEFATVLNRVFRFDMPAQNTFLDLDEDFYTRHILCLSEKGIMSGYEGKVRPNDYITREEASAMLCKVLTLESDSGIDQSFKDGELVSEWAMPYMTALVNEGYLKGDGGFLKPAQNITRAETVTLLSNALHIVTDVQATDFNKICVISRDDLSFKDCGFSKDVIVTSNVKKVDFENVRIDGSLHALTQKTDAIYLKNCDVKAVAAVGDKAVKAENTAPVVEEKPKEEQPAEEEKQPEEDNDDYCYDGLSYGGSDNNNEEDANVDEALKPTIETTLTDNLLQRNSKKVIDVIAKDKNGDKIPGEKCKVRLNGINIEPSWDDDAKTSFTLEFSESGEYTVEISASDAEGMQTQKTFNITYEMAEYGEAIGKAIVSIEAFTPGVGYIVAPMEIDVKEGVNCAWLLDELLTEQGLSYFNTGSLDGGFYLAHIENIPEFTPSFSAIITTCLSNFGFELDETSFEAGRLSEFDFTQGSGWMYCVNGVFPNVGFSEYYLQEGDVMRIQFTLAYGSDLGGASGAGYSYAGDFYEMVNRDELTRLIAEIGLDNCGEYMDLITKPDMTQDELNTVLDGLR